MKWVKVTTISVGAIFLALLPFWIHKLKAETVYRLDNGHGGKWHDAEKSRENKNDDWMCWASSAANVLAWTEWGEEAGFADEDEIFAYFSEHWKDHPAGSPREAWRWWFNGVNRDRGGADVTKKGGAFRPDVDFPWEKWGHRNGSLFRGVGQNQLKKDPSLLDSLLKNGYGVVLQIVRQPAEGGRESHMITLWGVRYAEQGGLSGILVTDSDDAKEVISGEGAPDSLVYYPLKLKEKFWWLPYRGEDWKILAAYALLKKSRYSD